MLVWCRRFSSRPNASCSLMKRYMESQSPVQYFDLTERMIVPWGVLMLSAPSSLQDSNICSAKIGQKLGRERLQQAFLAFGGDAALGDGPRVLERRRHAVRGSQQTRLGQHPAEGTALLGQVPILPSIREGGDSGEPVVVSEPRGAAAEVFRQIADALLAQLARPAPRNN